MKKLSIILCSVALLAGTAVAQNLDGSGEGIQAQDGSAPGYGTPGPHGNMDLSGIDGVPEDILALHEAMLAEREALRASRETAIEGLTDEAEIRAALEDWRAENQEAIDDIRANAQQVRDWFRANRPERPGAGQTDGMRQRRLQFRANVAEMQLERHQLRLQLQDPDLTEEEREALIQAFRDENRETMQRLRARKRQQRLEGDGGGDRRGNPGG